jgi:uncharacterized RDD family membrane protein YckC
MSSTEPPIGSTPPPGEPTPPPPPPPSPGAVPPVDQSMAPPPPPPAGAAAPGPGLPTQAYGPGQPGNLLDRFLAKLIDGLILGVVYAILSGIVGAIVYNGYHSGGEIFAFYLIIGILDAIIYVGYFAFMESSRGQSVGKMALKLKVFGPDGASNPTMEQAVKRNIYYALPLVLIIPVLGWILYPIAALAAVILILVGINSDPRRQHWFDKFAGGTQVVKIG